MLQWLSMIYLHIDLYAHVNTFVFPIVDQVVKGIPYAFPFKKWEKLKGIPYAFLLKIKAKIDYLK